VGKFWHIITITEIKLKTLIFDASSVTDVSKLPTKLSLSVARNINISLLLHDVFYETRRCLRARCITGRRRIWYLAFLPKLRLRTARLALGISIT